MANFFDQFDSAAPTGGNFFDKFDSKQQPVNPVADFAQSIPRGALSGLLGATSGPVIPDSPIPQSDIMTQRSPEEQIGALEKATGPLYRPQGRAGKFGASVGEMLGNPLSYVGPGGLPLKVGGAVLAGLGSEAGGQAAEGTSLETPARIAGGLAGGLAAGKVLGPTAPKAAIPTQRELKVAEDKLYAAARNSGVEVAPAQLANKATEWEQELTTGPKYAFTGGPEGTAPKTLDLLKKLQSPPEGATVTASNLDTLRRQINNIAGETKDFKPTPDAKAAMVLKRAFADYLESPPPGHIVAGNAEDFVRNIKEGNATHSALSNTNKIAQKITNAQDNTAGSIAATLGNQIKSQLRPILRNPKAQRGMTQEEVDAVRGVNKGTVSSNVLSQLGRGGAGVVPLGLHMAAGIPAALATGGTSIIPQLALAAALYGARKGGEQLTLRQAKQLQDLMAMRSPLYQQRLNALPPPDIAPNSAALVRGLLGGI